MNATERLQERYQAALMPNYGTPPLALARGEGCRVWDADGREYTDMFAGIAVSSLGHAHPAITEAVSRQVATLAHTSNLFVHEGEVALAERLLSLLGVTPGRVFFANSGTEANEAALKLVRRYQGPDRPVFVAAENGFHGRTMGALALTGKSSIREPFGPFGITVRFVPYGDVAALQAATRDDTAAVFLEPALGEGGVVPPPPGYLQAARDACDASGALLVADEIQSGIGRTGAWFACQADGVMPDVLTLAKGLGGGLPIGACIGLGDAGTAFHRGDHGSTFGGNPVACAAALARRGADPAARRPGRSGRAGGRLPGQRGPARRGPARAPADPGRGPGRRLPGRLAVHPRRGAGPGCRRPGRAGGLTCPATSCATTTSAPRSRPRCSTAPTR
jgi:acetylornithine/N-succinyldiaminopimelate aminotransferase